MRLLVIVGILLIAAGVVGLGYEGITYWSHDTVASAGPLEIKMDRPHTILFNPIVSAVILAAGVGAVLVGMSPSSKS